MADTKADTGSESLMSRREYRTGSLFQKCEARFGCPPLVDGERPQHKCAGRWFGTLESGYTASGARKRVTVSAKTKPEVVRRLRDKRLEMEAQGTRAIKRTTTVAKWSGQWLENIQTKVRPSAYETDRAAVRVIVAAIGATKLADLEPTDVRAVATYLRKRGKSTSTALRYHGSLMRMLKAASLDGYAIPPNVLLSDKPTKAVSDRDAVPPDQAIKALEVIARRTDGSRWALAFLQGLRQAEALGLTWNQVDLDAGTLTISWQVKSLRYIKPGDPAAGFHMPDGYEVRRLVGSTHLVRPKSVAGWRVSPLVPWAVNALRAWQDAAPANPHQLVWPGTPKTQRRRGETWPRNPATDRTEWQVIQKQAGIAHPEGRPWKVHEIRHGTATLLLELGVPESVRIAIMGHSSVASTRSYEHVDTTLAREALAKVATRLELG